jgi:2-methylisocitrate lyase-like PEP mutase family enzyme
MNTPPLNPAARTLRALLRTEACLPAPGVYDCLSAMLAAEAGFSAVSLSGYSMEASQFGLPDLGFMGLTDVETVARRVCASTSLPVICDADTGYGGPGNVWQTVRRLEAAGVAGLHIEDQADPKKCGGLPGRRVISVQDMAAKIRAACSARVDPDTVVIARSDAFASEGLDAVSARLNAYLASGADLAFAAENYSLDEVRRLARMVEGPLAICGGVPGWSGSHETVDAYAEIGVRLVIYPFTSLFVAAKAMRAGYAEMALRGGFDSEMVGTRMIDFSDFGRFIGVDVWSAREAGFGDAANGKEQHGHRSKQHEQPL